MNQELHRGWPPFATSRVHACWQFRSLFLFQRPSATLRGEISAVRPPNNTNVPRRLLVSFPRVGQAPAEQNETHPRSRRSRAQPQSAERRHSARSARRDHWRLRIRQELARLRHDLRRGPAEVHGVAERLRTAVPRSAAEARRRVDRRTPTDDRHPAAQRRAQPPFDGGHDHRDLRLSAPAARPMRPADLLAAPSRLQERAEPRLRTADRRHQRQPDRREPHADRRRPAPHDRGAGRPRKEGLPPRGDRGSAHAGLRSSPGERRPSWMSAKP